MNDPFVRQIVGRCHVAESNLKVICYVVSRLKHGRATFLALPRRTRRALLRAIIREHKANGDLFFFVMSGSRRRKRG